MDSEMLGEEILVWTDGTSEWTYNSKLNEVEIKKASSTSDGGDVDMFSGIADGYDISLKKETALEWQLQCKKSKGNKDKDAPGGIDLVVAKGSYYPLSLRTKVSGITMTMRDISFGVSEADVTFDAGAYPGIKVVDKR